MVSKGRVCVFIFGPLIYEKSKTLRDNKTNSKVDSLNISFSFSFVCELILLFYFGASRFRKLTLDFIS